MKTLFIGLTLIILSVAAFCQQPGITEQDLIKKAKSYYDKEVWKEALPLYAQLVSVYPQDATYNFRYGVCAMKGDRTNATRSIRYLTIAYQSMPENKELLYYLGMAYYQNQEFATALDFFFQSLDKQNTGSAESATINNYINLCQRGLELKHKNHLDEIVAKNEFQYDNFHRAYPADELEGSLIQKPQHFSMPQEVAGGEKSYVYITEPRGTVYYSGYADESATQRDLFVVTINANGEWGEPKGLSPQLNTAFDEAYPVVIDNGKTIYFSSKGHNSMGGYDVFKAMLDSETGLFGPPENMGIGINSPFDDILFIPEESGRGAYFSSNRESTDNNVTVFKVILNDGTVKEEFLLASAQTDSDPPAPAKEEVPKSIQPPAGTTLATADPMPKAKAGNEENNSTGMEQEPANSMKISWELVYEDDETEEPEVRKVEPVKQVQRIRYLATQSSWMDEEEILEIYLEPDMIPQVELVLFNNNSDALPEEESFLEIRLDPNPVQLVQMVRYAEARSDLLDDEEVLEIMNDPVIAQQVEAIAYAMAEEGSMPLEEELEVRVEADAVRVIRPLAIPGENETLAFEENLEISEEIESQPEPMVESGKDIKLQRYEASLSSLTAAGNSMVVIPQEMMPPPVVEHQGTNNQLIKRALNKPESLSYDELLYAASLTENPDIKLEIYYNTFVCIDRDWRAYYNASVAAEALASPEQAKLFLYQARLIYDDELVGQMGDDILRKLKK